MKDLMLAGGLSSVGYWLLHNQSLLFQYVVNICGAIVILLIGVNAARVASNMVSRMMKFRTIDITVVDFLSALVRYGLLVFTFITALSCIGVQTASVIAVLGAASLAVALALQGSLSNFAAGILLVIFRPLRVGEHIDLGGVSGTVKQVQIFSTTLCTSDNKIIIIPNSNIIKGNIINYSREPNRRVDIVVSVGYNADINVVKKALGDVITADKRILHTKGINVCLNEMTPTSLNFITRSWTINAEYYNVYFSLMENFKHALDAHGVSVPFPQVGIGLYPIVDANVKLKVGT